jgi:hypothetical protein
MPALSACLAFAANISLLVIDDDDDKGNAGSVLNDGDDVNDVSVVDADEAGEEETAALSSSISSMRMFVLSTLCAYTGRK